MENKGKTCASQSWAGWERKELEGVSGTSEVTKQEAGGRGRRGNASPHMCFAIFRQSLWLLCAAVTRRGGVWLGSSLSSGSCLLSARGREHGSLARSVGTQRAAPQATPLLVTAAPC